MGDRVGVVLDDSGQNGDRERHVARNDQCGDACGKALAPRVESGVIGSKATGRATRCRGTGGCPTQCLPTMYSKATGIRLNDASMLRYAAPRTKSGLNPPPSEISEVPSKEGKHGDAGPAH